MKNKFVILIIILSIFTFAGCGVNSNKKSSSNVNNKLVNENDIASLKIHNMKGEFKDIKNKSDINKVVTLVNSITITKSNVGLKDGIGYGIEIIYSDSKKEDVSFCGNFMVHNNKYYEINKNITNKLKEIYDRN